MMWKQRRERRVGEHEAVYASLSILVGHSWNVPLKDGNRCAIQQRVCFLIIFLWMKSRYSPKRVWNGP